MQLTDGAPGDSAKDHIAADFRDAQNPPPRGGLGLKDDLVMALRFFSRLPTGDSPHERPELSRIAMALPFASVLMGLIPIALIFSVWLGLPAYFAAALAVGAMVVVGGGMMEDALADAADGLFGGTTAQRRLEILKDSRHGTYGVAALCLFLLLRVTAIGSVAAFSPLAAGGIWLAANIAGRSGSLWMAVALPAARPDGAAATAGSLPISRFLIGSAFAGLLVFVIGAPASSLTGVILAIGAVGLVTFGWTALCRRLVGGQTGDLVGAAAGLGEVAALAVLLIFAATP